MYRVMKGLVVVGVCAAALAAAGCGSSSSSSSTSSGGGDKQGPFNVALSMSYVGNDWQNEAENLVKATAASPPYKDKVKLRVDIAGASVPKQIQQINAEVAAGMDAIIMYPISPTALNVAIRNACKKGVIVYAYNADVTEPCAYNVKTSDVQYGYEAGQWIGKLLNGKGNIATLTGVSGTSADTDRNNGFAMAMKQYPGIKTVATGNGMWDPAITKKVFAGIDAAHPDLDAVWAQTSCQAVEDYLISQGKKPLPCSGEAEQGWRLDMLAKDKGGQGITGLSMSSPAYTGELALMNAVAILEGDKSFKKNMLAPMPLVTNETIKPGTNVAEGANVYPASAGVEVPEGFFDSFYSPLVSQGLKAAQTGAVDTVSTPKSCAEVPGCAQSDSLEVFQRKSGPTVPY